MSVRSPMQWSSEPHRGFTTADEPCRPIAPGEAEVAAQRRDPDSLLTWMELLIRRRRECPELGWGSCEILETGDPAVFAHCCAWRETEVIAVHNLADRPAKVRLVLRPGPPGPARCECGAPLLWGSRFCANCGRPSAAQVARGAR